VRPNLRLRLHHPSQRTPELTSEFPGADIRVFPTVVTDALLSCIVVFTEASRECFLSMDISALLHTNACSPSSPSSSNVTHTPGQPAALATIFHLHETPNAGEDPEYPGHNGMSSPPFGLKKKRSG